MQTAPRVQNSHVATTGVAPPSFERRGLTLVTLCLATFVAQIDTAVVNLATQPIGRDLDVGIDALQWIVDSYNLVYAVMLLTGGLLADLCGRRRMFMIGAGLFTAASLLCCIAPSAAILIAGRAFAGLGAALLIPASLAIVRVVWLDQAQRGRVLGFWSACTGLAMAIGPTLGGLIIGHLGWRGIFLVVIPLSPTALALAPFSIPESSHPDDRHFDGFAQLLGAIALGALSYGAIALHETPHIAIAAFIISLLSLAMFLRIEAKRGDVALVPLDIFRSRRFVGLRRAPPA